MLKDAGLCLMECVFLMLRSDACKLFPVLCRLFPEVEEMFEIITWNDREYFVRELTLFRGTGGEYKTLVSVTGLQDVLVGKDGAPISDEAEAVDRKICYYFTGRGVPAAGRAACGPCGGCVRNHNVCTKTRK